VQRQLLALLAAAGPLSNPIQADSTGSSTVSGVVGQPVTVALPVGPGESWDVFIEGGRRVHGMPYRFRMGSAGPEIWTFPLVAPGRSEVAFRLNGGSQNGAEASEKRVVIRSLTPFEAQQVAPGALHGTLLRP